VLNRIIVEAAVERIQRQQEDDREVATPATIVAPPVVNDQAEEPREGIKDLIERLTENLQNVSPEEAEVIMAKITEAAAAFAAGRWLVGGLAIAAAFRLYRDAIKS
jgi:NifB/MoaA-like Fe-S oxidoreductase